MAALLQLLLFLSLPLPLLSSAPESLSLLGGYSLSAASLSLSLSSPAAWNRSGTLLAPPDSAFSSSLYPRFRPSLSLLLSHTLRPRLTFHNLSSLSLSPPHPIATWQPYRCLNSISTVKIVHPDIYVDDDLIVHGTDRLITDDLTIHCSAPNPTAEIKSHLLDHAARVLRKKRFGVVAAALNSKKENLLKIDGVTVFATSDENLFSETNGFFYDFLRHVVPKRYRLDDIRRMRSVETLGKARILTVGSESSYSEIYFSRWIVVIGMTRGFDDERSDGVYGEEDYLFCPVRERESEPLVSEKMVESAPSHQMNKEGESEPLDGRVLGESTVEMGRRRMSALGVGRNSEGPKIVQFQVADDLFYYT